MARHGLKFDILASPKAEKAKPAPMGSRVCSVCGGLANFGEGRRVEVATWFCFDHWPHKAERAA